MKLSTIAAYIAITFGAVAYFDIVEAIFGHTQYIDKYLDLAGLVVLTAWLLWGADFKISAEKHE